MHVCICKALLAWTIYTHVRLLQTYTEPRALGAWSCCNNGLKIPGWSWNWNLCPSLGLMALSTIFVMLSISQREEERKEEEGI